MHKILIAREKGFIASIGKLKHVVSLIPLPILAAVCGTFFALLLLGVLAYFNLDAYVLELLQWLKGLGNQAAWVFVAIMAATTALLLPGVLFTVGAGFVFGVVEGTMLVVVGTTAGAAVAFLISRYLFSEKASRFFLSHVNLRAASHSMVNDGARIVFFTRLIPLFPFKISNYFFGLTPVRFRDFIVGTSLGIIPFSLHNAYLGSIASDIVSVGNREAERSPAQWLFYVAGLVLVIIAVSSLARIARKALKLNTEDA